MTRIASCVLLLASMAPGPEGEESSPCPLDSSRACVLELRGAGPAIGPACLSETWRPFLTFELPDRVSDANGDGHAETVLRIDLDPARGCGCVVFRVAFDRQPAGHVVDIGDSPTVDGFGGDAGTTPKAAEVHLEDRRLSVYSDLVNHTVDNLLGLELPDLGRGVLELRVCDQYFGFAITGAAQGGLRGEMHAVNSQRLFSITEENYSLWAAFNRVVHVRGGRPAQGRSGSGVRRVEIYLTP